MREILFRGKHTRTGEWVEGLLWKKKYNHDQLFISCFPDKDDNEEIYIIKPETVGQYTGLTDKNGKKIFEGDIVSFKECVTQYDYQYPILNYDNGTFKFPEIRTKENRVGVVKWCGDLLQYRVFFSRNCGTSRYELGDYRLESLLVIGNIHDNPELLKGGGDGESKM